MVGLSGDGTNISRSREVPHSGFFKSRLLPAAAVLVLVAAIYLIINLVLPGRLSGFSSSFVVQPILWCSLIVGVLALRRREARLGLSRSMLWIGLLMGDFHLAVILIAALFTGSGFGGSPYAHSLRYLFLNTILFGTAVVGLEFSRAYLLNTLSWRHATPVVILISLAYTCLMIPLTQFTHPTDASFMGGICLPLLAQNVLASFLALLGGPIASIAYWGILKAFEWYSPILPDIPWILNAFAGTLAAVIGLLALQEICRPRIEPATEAEAEPRRKSSSLSKWVTAGIASVVIIFASFGALGFRPMIVGSGSMSPALNVGDIAVVKPVSVNSVSEGDIIQFVENGMTKIHRVIEVRRDGRRVFITQGDANDSPDLAPVQAEQIQGKVRLRIPKLGWVSIGIKRLLT